MIKESLIQNSDIKTAMVNIDKAQAVFNISQAERLPNVGLTGSITRRRDSDNLSSTFSHETYNVFNFSAIMSYQVDIWGKMAAASKAAKKQLEALESTKKTVEITVTSEVAKAYFNLIALDNKIKIKEKIFKLDEELVALKAKQYKVGKTNLANVEQVRSESYLANSELLLLKQQLVKHETALSVLIGRDVEKSVINRAKSLNNITIPSMQADLNSKILLKRPDIIAAEQMLQSAKYRVDVARASYFPEISLNALLGRGSNYTGTLLDKESKTKSIEGDLYLPVLDFGRISSNVAYSKAEKSQALIDYEHTIRTAFAEAISSLSSYKSNNQNYTIMLKNKESAEKIYKIASSQFKHGKIDKLQKIMAEKRYLLDLNNTIDSALLRLNSTVDVFKALGGDY